MLIIIKDVIYEKIKKFFSLTFFLKVIMIFQCETAYHHSTLKNQQAKKKWEKMSYLIEIRNDIIHVY